MSNSKYQADYGRREVLKSEAWAVLIRQDSSSEQKASAALDLIRSHYGRAMDERAGRARNAPDFNTYCRHWLWANGEKTLPREVLEILMFKCGLVAEQSKLLPKGHTSYMRAKGAL